MTFTKHHDMNECPACLHYHRGSRCGEPITEDVYVSDSAFGGRKRGLSGGGTFGGGLDLRLTRHGHIHFRNPRRSDR